jgi:hypothetical protein
MPGHRIHREDSKPLMPEPKYLELDDWGHHVAARTIAERTNVDPAQIPEPLQTLVRYYKENPYGRDD